MIIDTHCHLVDERFLDKAQVVNEYLAGGVSYVVNAGYDMPSSREGKTLASLFPSVFFTVGIHPDQAERVLDDALSELLTLSQEKKAVAVGEIGLDYHYLPFDKEVQKKAFVRQIELAEEAHLPFVVHSRDASADTVAVLRQEKTRFSSAVMHCYAGSVETAKLLLDLGMYFSFSGTLTFKNARNLQEVAQFLPLDRILIETDSPYLAPEPFRGKENRPLYVKQVFQRLSELRNIDSARLEEQLFCNTLSVFPKIKEWIK